ncbi:MAG: ABC transporter ATP-binding protein [Cyanobacteria bacterium P01_F01_bin.150]
MGHPDDMVTGKRSSAVAAGVSLRSVTKNYGSVVALENMTLDIPAGQYCCLLGPSGCGKTTALRIISGHESVTEGDVLIGDRPVNDLPPAKRNTAMMFQNYALFPHKTIWQNVDFGLKMQRVSKAERHQRVGDILDLVGLSHTADRKPHMLSGGQQQRIALARALVTRPQVLMLDEPLSALDENLRVRMRGELRKIQKQFGLTFIQVTHHVEEAFALSDQIVVMNHGHIEQVASPAELFSTPASQFVAGFMGENNILKGKVIGCTEGYIKTEPANSGSYTSPPKDLIELEVEGIGPILCQGYGMQPGVMAACSVRPDLLTMIVPADRSPGNSSSVSNDHLNQLSARIVDVELTGYVTRVSLLSEANGQELLYKVRTQDWFAANVQEGQSVILQWLARDCVFLPY